MRWSGGCKVVSCEVECDCGVLSSLMRRVGKGGSRRRLMKVVEEVDAPQKVGAPSP